MFRTWRKERIQKLKEQDEAEIMAEPAPIFSAIVQSGVTIVALETDSKPWTVSHEEGEDDTAPNTVYYNMHTNVAKDIEEQVSTLHPPDVRSNIHDKLDMHVPCFIRFASGKPSSAILLFDRSCILEIIAPAIHVRLG
jgi:hypothetical protein